MAPEPMYFLRCSADHHSLAIAHSPVADINHVSFELCDVDEYLLSTGGSRDRPPLAVGPGRHSPGDNVYSYLAGPDGFVRPHRRQLRR